MISGLIPSRYARALYKYAEESSTCAAVYAEMKNVITAFRQNPQLEKALSNPFIAAGDKRKLLIAAAGTEPGDDYRRFVTLILDHHREEFAYLMALAYRDIYRKENNIAQVRIVTAVKLPDAELEKLRGVIRKSFPKMTFEIEYEIDPDIIGGFVIDVDSTRMDASLSNELEQLRLTLTSN